MKKLLQQIRQYANSISSISTWNGKDIISANSQDDYIYEFYCCIRIVADFKKNYTINLIPGKKNKFAMKPLPKKDYSKFLIKSKNNNKKNYQVCPGTNIRISNINNYTVGPDISIQKEKSTDDPTEKDVVLIMDSKYKSKPGSKVGISILREFAKIVEELKVNSASTIDLEFDTLKDLKNNCIITNGQGRKNSSDYCKVNSIIQIENFNIKAKHNVAG